MQRGLWPLREGPTGRVAKASCVEPSVESGWSLGVHSGHALPSGGTLSMCEHMCACTHVHTQTQALRRYEALCTKPCSRCWEYSSEKQSLPSQNYILGRRGGN